MNIAATNAGLNNGSNGPSVPKSAVQITQSGAIRIITLDRPDARNALDGTIRTTLAAAIPQIARDANTYAIVLRSSRPGVFCAGGDVRELMRLNASAPAMARKALADEYSLIWLLECFSKPVVALIDGAVMGAGAGITQVNTHRVAGEDYAFAMPEVQLGFFPDDGMTHTLARLPGAVGAYLALTGRRLRRADAYTLGLVTHCIDANHFPAIETRLADASPVDPVLDALHRHPGAGEIAALRPLIDDCFGSDDLAQIIARLAGRSAAGDETARSWARKTLAELEAASPLALKVALRHVRQSRALDLRQTLALDYRLATRMIAAHDFAEGVRASLIDKDRSPRWRPGNSAEISDAFIDDLFRPTNDTFLNLPTRQEMQAARV